MRAMPTGKETTKGEIEVEQPLSIMEPFTNLLASNLDATSPTVASIQVDDLFPKLLRLGQRPETGLLDVSYNAVGNDGKLPKKDVSVELKLHRSPRDGTLYWTFDV